MTFRQKFAALGVLLLVGFALATWKTRSIMDEVMVNGPLYHQVVQGQDIVADILPPPKFIVEAHLLAYRIIDCPTGEVRDELLDRFEECRSEYEERQAHWVRELDAGRGGAEREVVEQLLRASHEPAEEYFRLAQLQFIPAVVRADPNVARAVLVRDMEPLFIAHHKAIQQTVAAARSLIAEKEAAASMAVESGRVWTLGVGLGVLGVLGLAAYLAFSSVLRAMESVTVRMKSMAEGEADLTARLAIKSRDEVGQLARQVDAFVAKIGGLVKNAAGSTAALRETCQTMAETSRSQESTVQQFGASTAEVAAAVREISATQMELGSAMSDVQRAAQESAQTAVAGREGLGEMRDAMKSLAGSSASISERLTTINDRTQDISSIVVAITKVADQTNLLSVNAAIEAEKAGDAGRGFLVVAREIRRLADQTAQATLDIERMVGARQGAVTAGVMEMDKFAAEVHKRVEQVGGISASLGGVIDGVAEMKERFTTVGEGMNSQAVGAQQISDAMASLSGNVRTTVSSLGEFTGAAERMRGAVAALDAELAKFRV